MFHLFKRKKKESSQKEMIPSVKEEGSRKENALFEVIRFLNLESYTDEIVDEVRNHTPYTWMELRPEANLTQALEKYAEYKVWAKEYDHRLNIARGKVAIVTKAFDHSAQEKNELFTLCHDFSVKLFLALGDGTFEDCETGERYQIRFSSTYPGMVDDAATYIDAYLENLSSSDS